MIDVILFHSEVPEDAPEDEKDVLIEADYMAGILNRLGYTTRIEAFTLDINRNLAILEEVKPQFIVNLVETAAGTGRLVHLGPDIFELARIDYTGSPAEAIYLTSNKILSKRMMNAAGIRVTSSITLDTLDVADYNAGKQFIVKALWEHASVGIDENTLKLCTSRDELCKTLRFWETKRIAAFSEEYIDGREFNISMLGHKNGFDVLPIAEMRFVDYPKDKIKVVGYRSKWDEKSFEYHHTIRSFDFGAEDDTLLANLKDICSKCWNLFGLKGYVRVDFRVDTDNNPFVLEINANPGISPDSGFIAACQRAGIGEDDLLSRIVEDRVRFS